ncbi:hypothetical protein ACJJTC_018498 [Scirpophaga incertulas]
MPKCFLCRLVLPDIKCLCSHIKVFHKNSQITYYACAEQNCDRKYFLINSYKKHLASHGDLSCNRSVLVTNNNAEINNENNLSNRVIDPSEVLNVDASSGSGNSTTNCQDLKSSSLNQQKNHFAQYMANLYANPLVPRNVSQFVFDNMLDLINNSVVQPLKCILNESATMNNISEDSITPIKNHLHMITNHLQLLSSEHLRLEFYKKSGTYIVPVEYTLGNRIQSVYSSNVLSVEPISVTAQHIPLRLVLQKFFELKDVLVETLAYYNDMKNSSDGNFLQNIIQGSEWQKKQNLHHDKTVLPLALFHDDYEVGNPLGSHAGVHELGATYVAVLCFPPHYRAKIQNIFLASLCHSEDRQYFGNKIVFSPIITELNFLKNEGIFVNVSGTQTKLFFELAVILGDNLGVHSITGFTESFSCNFSCRICKIPKERMQYQISCDPELKRTMTEYLLDVDICNVSTTGIKAPCVWHSVAGFSVIDHVGVDIMHDLLEGVCKYDLILLIHIYINELKNTI